ncbi:putative ribonuclease H [Vibrio phage 207E48.1]|nr:putative ribonuclease H [Vibrio phage 207E48.1]
MIRRPLKIYTDGASYPHQKDPEQQFAGWAIVLVMESVDYVYYGRVPAPASNNVAEMIALTAALAISKGMKAKTFTDNEYAINSLIKWRSKWERVGLPVTNRQYIRHLWEVYDERTASVEIKWIRGHVGHHYNEVADAYAKKGKENDIKSGKLCRVAYRGFDTPEQFFDFVQRMNK